MTGLRVDGIGAIKQFLCSQTTLRSGVLKASHVNFCHANVWNSLNFQQHRSTQCGHEIAEHQKTPLDLHASMFRDILAYRSATSEAYIGRPLSGISGSRRGRLIQRLVRCLDEELHPFATILDPVPGECVNGRRRGKASAAYDWLRSGRRIECKSAQLKWNSSQSHWLFEFCNIKFAVEDVRMEDAFDELLLAMYTPLGIYIYLHDFEFGICRTRSIKLEGRRISIVGPRGMHDWRKALHAILAKIDKSSCKHIAFIPLADPLIQQVMAATSYALTDEAYSGVPLADTNETVRGACLEGLVHAVDTQHLNPTTSICKPLPSFGINVVKGNPSGGPYKRECDWIRNGLRVECKSSKMAFDAQRKCWRLKFDNIKFALPGQRDEPCFDELKLAIYTPCAVFIYCHDFQLGVARNGVKTSAHGHQIGLYGPAGESDWNRALDAILGKLNDSSCKHLATVWWDQPVGVSF